MDAPVSTNDSYLSNALNGAFLLLLRDRVWVWCDMPGQRIPFQLRIQV